MTEIKIDADGLAARLRGAVVQPSDPGYDEARKLYNAMIDRRPALIAQVADVEDVVTAVRFGREHELELAIRGGGHNGAGLASVDGGLAIDLSALSSVDVDPDARTVTIGGGALLGDVDAATGAHGLATPAGIISTTGAGGLMLGGGVGYLTRRAGLSIDNILGAQVVLADGSVVEVDEETEPDLYWAIRGGGGNFGVVTSIRSRLHPVGDVVAGPMFWDLDAAGDILRWYREFILAAPEELGGFFLFASVPPAPPFPEELHLRKVAAVIWCWTGPPEQAAEVLEDARAQDGLLLDGVQPMPLTALQSAFDPVYPPGDQWYWRGDFVTEIPDAAIEVHRRFAEALPTWKSTMHLYPIDGAAHRVGPADTPWAYREANWASVIAGVDPDPANAEAITRWTVDYFDALHPYTAGGSYVNFLGEGEERVQATYRENYARLAAIKAEYDPENVFHVNQNIRPAA
ncbi:MAG TPA: FAD-binding oxidoreductase [Gaiellaceae bacterium]|nr:FAD-binding oxidoreductase [Gaiellaceae bacterium]